MTDRVAPALIGRGGSTYESPPQTREQALALVRLLLGLSVDPAAEEQPWTGAIAGGQRVVTITEQPRG